MPYTPQRLSEYIGQEDIVAQVRVAIGASKARGETLPHILLTGVGGLLWGYVCFCHVFCA